MGLYERSPPIPEYEYLMCVATSVSLGLFIFVSSLSNLPLVQDMRTPCHLVIGIFGSSVQEMRTPSTTSSGLPGNFVPAYAVASVLRYAIRREVGWASSIDHTSIDDAIDAESRKPSRWDRLVQRVFRESTILPAPLHGLAVDSIRAKTAPILFMSRIVRWYCALLRARGVAWPEGLPEARRRQLAAIAPEDVRLPSFRKPLELLEFALGELDLLDLVRAAPDGSPGTLVLCTAFVDRFELKDLVGDGYGATLRLSWRVGGGFRVDRLDFGGRRYPRAEIPAEAAWRALWGIYSYVSVGTHLYYTHGVCGAGLTALSRRTLERAHPLRRLLLPTELGTTNGLARAVPALLSDASVAGSMFATSFPWTVGGLRSVVRSYEPWNPLDASDPRSQLMQTELDAPVVGDLGRWWRHVLHFVSRAVDVLYDCSDDELERDAAAVRWLDGASWLLGTPSSPACSKRAHLATVVSLAFFIQVRHNFGSNACITHVARWSYILRPGPVPVAEPVFQVLVLIGVTAAWVPMVGRGFESLSTHAGVRRVMEDFYASLASDGPFAQSLRHAMAKPEELECSTGL